MSFSESKEGSKAPGYLLAVTYHYSLSFNPGVAVEGRRFFADADQEFWLLPSGLEEPEQEQGSSETAPLTMRDPRGQLHKKDQPPSLIPAVKHRKAPWPGLHRALSDKTD